MEVVATTGAVRRAKLQSNRHYQQTNIQLSQFVLTYNAKYVCESVNDCVCY